MVESKYIKINGIEIHYLHAGSGTPLVMLHGNGESSEIFREAIERLSLNYEVFAPDSRCHGKSEKTAEVGYLEMSQDMAAFLTALKLENVNLYGFSDGGIIGLMLAIDGADIGRLIVSGANLNPNGLKKWFLGFCKFVYALTRNKLYKIMCYSPQIEPSALKSVNCPVLVTAGSRDIVRQEHTRLIAQALPNSTLKVFEGETHGSYVLNTDKLCAILKTFFK